MSMINPSQSKKIGRPNRNAERQYFAYDPVDGISRCLVPNCKASIKGNHLGNLGKHLARFHSAQWKLITEKKEKSNLFENNSILTVALTVEEIQQACMEMVTLEGRPFSSIDGCDSQESRGFRRIIDAILKAPELNNKITVSSATVRQTVREKANEVRQDIKDEITGRIIHLKVDGATRYNRSFLGVNIQFVEGGYIHLRTLGLIELKERHASEYLEKEIQIILKTYEISIQQINTFTTDNGANMIKLGKLMIEAQTRDEAALKTDLTMPNEEENDEEVDIKDEYDLDMDINADFTQYDENTKMHYIDTSNSLSLSSETCFISNIRCAAHTLQLAVHDALKSHIELKSLIVKVREAARGLRTPNVRLRLENNTKMPKLDVVTRWHSTYDMFESIMEHKEFCCRYPKVHKSLAALSSEWKNIEEVVISLRPAKIASKKLQEEQLTLGSFFGIWQCCKYETKEIPGTLANKLYQAMCTREKQLLENDVLLSCVYLDPRFSLLLTEDRHVDTALNTLVNIYEKSSKIEDTTTSHCERPHGAASTPTSTQTIEPNSETISQYQSPAFLKVLNEAIAKRSTTLHGVCIRQLLIDFRESTSISPDVDILHWWETHKIIHPQLYQLAKIVNGAAATEVSVERLFSGMHYIYSSLRTNMKSDILNDILVIRCNERFKANITRNTLRKRKSVIPLSRRNDITPAKASCTASTSYKDDDGEGIALQSSLNELLLENELFVDNN